MRFLWRKNHRQVFPDEFEMVAMIFGVVSSPTSVMRRNVKEFEDTHQEAVKAIFCVNTMLTIMWIMLIKKNKQKNYCFSN